MASQSRGRPSSICTIIQSWGAEKGQEYLDETKRIDGWVIYFKRTKSGAILPEQIFCNPVQFESTTGAEIAYTNYNNVAQNKPGWELLQDDLGLGDQSRAVIYKEDGSNTTAIFVDFLYRNYSIRIASIGNEREAKLETTMSVAQNVLERMKRAKAVTP